jgi:hypothetical protein
VRVHRRVAGLLVLALALLPASCGAPGGSGSTPASQEAGPSAAASEGSGQFSGDARVTLTYAGTSKTFEGGECDLAMYPEGFGEGWYFAINIGTPSADPTGPDYFGILTDVADDGNPDGTWTDAIITVNQPSGGFNVGSPELTIREGGASGEFNGTAYEIGPVEGEFTCD